MVNMPMAPSPDPSPFDRFARFYDGDYRHYDEDLDLIGHYAGEHGDPILELGCGTGRVLLSLARAGHRLTGIDISPALLERAQARLQQQRLSAQVELLQADLRTFDLPAKNYGFAFCTSSTLMHLTTAQEQLAALRNIARHLRPGGRLLIDLFNPDLPRLFAVEGLMELADRWLDEQTGAEVLKWSVRRLDLAEQLQETLFLYEEIHADGRLERTACPFTLRFLWRNEAELMLQAAGLAVEEVMGDCEGTPYASDSEHLILVAAKPETR